MDCPLGLCRSFNVGQIVQNIEDAMLICYADDGDRGVATGEEKFLVQTKHFGNVGIDDTTVGEDENTLPDMLAGNFIQGIDDALAKGFGGFASFDRVPTACNSSNTYNID